jgi:ribonuclease BN (tRNA processing enzyme)
LVHEGGLANDYSAYFREFHTRADDLGKVAAGAKPKLLILYHQRNANEDGLRIIRSQWSGRVVVANDLQVFE